MGKTDTPGWGSGPSRRAPVLVVVGWVAGVLTAVVAGAVEHAIYWGWHPW